MARVGCDFIQGEELYTVAQDTNGKLVVEMCTYVGMTPDGRVVTRRGDKVKVGLRPGRYFKCLADVEAWLDSVERRMRELGEE